MPDAPGVVSIEREFLDWVLPRVSDLPELKLILAVLEVASSSGHQFVALEALLQPAIVRSVCGTGSPEPAETRMKRVIDRAVANGFLLRVAFGQAEGDRSGDSSPGPRNFLLAATNENRSRIDALGDRFHTVDSVPQIGEDAEVIISRPNIFSLYEQYIGPLTPLIAEQLREAERSYPRAWLERAFQLASEYDRHSWRYVEAVLSDWEHSGAPTLP